MAELKIEKKTEYFIVGGNTQEAPVYLVKDSETGSLLFVFRHHFCAGWLATKEAPYGFCTGAQEAPEDAEFYLGMVRPHESGLWAPELITQIEHAQRSFSMSQECFLKMINGDVIDNMRKSFAGVKEDRARQAREEAELKKLRDEFDNAPMKDRADLSGLSSDHLKALSLEWEWESPYIDQTGLVLRQAGEIRAHFWVSKERRRAEFNVSGGWNPAAYSAEEIPQRGLRIPVIRALKFLEERISQILPAPRLPNEIAGRSFTGKGFEFWLARMSQGPFGLDEACMASYGVSALALKTDWEKVWELEEVLDQARKIVRARHRVRNGFYVWKISKESIDQARRDGKFLIGYFSE